MDPAVRIRPARPSEEGRLREIAAAAKGHWGYDPVLVRRWASSIDFSAAAQETYVATAAGRAVAWAAIDPRGDVIWLADLWVEPAWMGKGVGTLLYRRCAGRARELGGRTMEWEAEPNSVGFYERVGGRYLRDGEPGEWGRVLPVMGVDLTGRTRGHSRDVRGEDAPRH
jgi:GNAT superfamily N-acetyltransferase